MKKVLFVCLGNICRSPAAEGVLQKMVESAGLTPEDVFVDSCGTGNWHVGGPADGRMRAAAEERNYTLNSRARQFSAAEDFEGFDLIVPMDASNMADVLSFDTQHQRYTHKVKAFKQFSPSCPGAGVPDPYKGGMDGFHHVMDLLEEGCSEILKQLQAG